MPRTVTLDDGTEIELPDNILSEIKDEAVEEFKGEYGDPEELRSELDARESEKADLEDKIRIAAEKGENASKLREQLKVKEREVEEAKRLAQESSANSNNLLIDQWKEDAVSKISDDPEIKKVFEAKYELLANMPSGSKAEIQARIDAALDLTSPGWRSQMVDSSAFSSSTARGGAPRKDTGLTPEAKELAGALDITDESIEKYGGKRV